MAETRHQPPPREPAARSEVPIVDPPKPPGGYLPDPPDVPAPTQARADYHKVETAGGEEVVMRGVKSEALAHEPPTPTQEEADRIRGGSEAKAREALKETEHQPHTPTQEEANQHRTRVMGAGDAQQYQTR